MLARAFCDVEGEGDDLAVPWDVAEEGVEPIDGEQLSDLSEEVLGEAGDGAAGRRVMSSPHESGVVKSVMLEVRKFPFPLHCPAEWARFVSWALCAAPAARPGCSGVPGALGLPADLLPAR